MAEKYNGFSIRFEKVPKSSGRGWATYLTHISKNHRHLITLHDDTIKEGRERAHRYIDDARAEMAISKFLK